MKKHKQASGKGVPAPVSIAAGYVAPAVKALDISVEKGFAGSGDYEDLQPGGEGW